MIQILIPDNFIPERKYIIDIFFNMFLGLDYVTELHKEQDYHIVIENNRLIFKDFFFSKFNEKEGYIDIKNIPQKIDFVKNDFIPEKNIPVIFGTDEFEIKTNPEKTIVCGMDIFASAFFMLTRWEEIADKTRDAKHARFPVECALSYKNNFLHRPVVNEYVEFLWNLLIHLGIKQARKSRNYRIIPTHDIDLLYFPSSLLNIGGDFLRTKNLSLPLKRLKYSLTGINYYDTFDWLMDLSEDNNTISHFYFLNSQSNLDATYSINQPFILKTVRNIINRNHIVGIHASYHSYNNENIFRQEKEGLESTFNLKISEGRQHFLRFENPVTWDILNNNRMEIDSTLGYAESEGFRCGTGDIFNVFNVLTRQSLSLKEKPLILMDASLQYNNQKNSIAESIRIFNTYRNICKKYKMPFTILFHNSSFDPVNWKGWKKMYETLMQ